jgi:hypothetical protein
MENTGSTAMAAARVHTTPPALFNITDKQRQEDGWRKYSVLPRMRNRRNRKRNLEKTLTWVHFLRDLIENSD